MEARVEDVERMVVYETSESMSIRGQGAWLRDSMRLSKVKGGLTRNSSVGASKVREKKWVERMNECVRFKGLVPFSQDARIKPGP